MGQSSLGSQTKQLEIRILRKWLEHCKQIRYALLTKVLLRVLRVPERGTWYIVLVPGRTTRDPILQVRPVQRICQNPLIILSNLIEHTWVARSISDLVLAWHHPVTTLNHLNFKLLRAVNCKPDPARPW